MKHQPVVAPEFSRPVALESLRDGNTALYQIVAGAAECAALAKRFDLLAIDRLSADVRLRPEPGGRRLACEATFRARVVQACVVTLEPVASDIVESVAIRYERLAGPLATKEVDISIADDCEPLIGDSIDIGEIVAEELALALDPYPRAPDASLALPEASDGGANGNAGGGPFEGLAGFKRTR